MRVNDKVSSPKQILPAHQLLSKFMTNPLPCVSDVFLFPAKEGIGQMCSNDSAAAPEFFLHHGFVDKLWGDWRKCHTQVDKVGDHQNQQSTYY